MNIFKKTEIAYFLNIGAKDRFLFFETDRFFFFNGSRIVAIVPGVVRDLSNT